ncbi:MAG: hypothetical protein WBB39_00705 [Candidatus Saccharimonadales bacterium]
MFRKIVLGLSYSPSLIEQVGHYALRLKNETKLRRVSLIATVAAIMVQLLIVFAPVQSVNGTAFGDIVPGGASTLNDFLRAYDSQTSTVKQLVTSLGINREDIEASRETTINSVAINGEDNGWRLWNRQPLFSLAQKEIATHISSNTVVYSRPLTLYDTSEWSKQHGTRYTVYLGHSHQVGEFAIIKSSGNLLTKRTPNPSPATITLSTPTSHSPINNCETIIVNQIDRTRFSLTVPQPSPNNEERTFVVRGDYSDGKIITKKTVRPTSNGILSSGEMQIQQSGTYYASVAFATQAAGSRSCTTVFAIASEQGCSTKPDLIAVDKECQPCPNDPSLWYKDTECSEKIARSLSVINLTQNVTHGETMQARAGDRLQYAAHVTNMADTPIVTSVSIIINDGLEYATILDNGGADYSVQDKKLEWKTIEIPPGGNVTRTFTMKILDNIPAIARNIGTPSSYDSLSTITFGNSISVPVETPAPKIVEVITEQLPMTTTPITLLTGLSVFLIVAFLYARAQQLSYELRQIRREFNGAQ